MQWSPQEISNRFRWKAESFDQCAREMKIKAKSNKNYELLYDLTLADFWVYDHLRASAFFISSRLALLHELRSMLASERRVRSAAQPFDMERFLRYWRASIDSLIKEYEQP
jgi:hypothetical protein